MTPLERFMTKVDKQHGDGCWLWIASLGSNGYGQFQSGNGMVRAHRWLYEQIFGSLPNETDLDHLCRVRSCVRPSHLDPVTRQINVLRGDTIPARNAAKTHCLRGHQFTVENTYITRLGQRRCQECNRQRSRDNYLARKVKP